MARKIIDLELERLKRSIGESQTYTLTITVDEDTLISLDDALVTALERMTDYPETETEDDDEHHQILIDVLEDLYEQIHQQLDDIDGG